MMQNDDEVTEPSNDEVMQDESPDMVTVPVRVEGPVRVQQLPSKGGGETITFTLADGGEATKILNADPMRRSAVILATDYSIYVATSQAGCRAASGMLWTKSIPLPWNAVNELWAIAAESGHASVVSLVTERWTD